MEYNAFLNFLHQMESQRKAKVVVQGSVIFIETTGKSGHWSLSTKILRVENKKLEKTLSSYLSRSKFQWQSFGPHITFDRETESVELVQEIVPSKKYIPFKFVMEDFANVASEWKEIFEEYGDQEDLIPRFA